MKADGVCGPGIASGSIYGSMSDKPSAAKYISAKRIVSRHFGCKIGDMLVKISLVLLFAAVSVLSQAPLPIEPGVSQELAQWRAAHYSDVRYKLNLTLEKMSPVLKGTIEIRVRVRAGEGEKGSGGESGPRAIATGPVPPIILDWREIKGHEEKSTITNVTVNGQAVTLQNHPVAEAATPLLGKEGSLRYEERDEHLIFRDGVVVGENVITLDFTSPILTSGSAITRYIDKEDGSEYIYSLFVPSDASTAFPVFDQPDMKARWQLTISSQTFAKAISNENKFTANFSARLNIYGFMKTPPISPYVFAFAVGDFVEIKESEYLRNAKVTEFRRWSHPITFDMDTGGLGEPPQEGLRIYVRKSQAEKFKSHAAEVFRLNREAIKFFEEYFDYKFPFSKYDLVLIPEFPFGGMEHAGATFLRESAIIFPQEPTANDHISRALLIFHEAAHQWFGDTVTMKWFDDLWLKEGFANFAAYKALEKIMPEANAWKVFYERVKQAAYRTDSTKGTTPIYQEIKNLSAAKSAYGAIVYSKAPAFLRQAEFYLGEDKFQTAVRAFLKKHEYANATWEDLVKEFEEVYGADLLEWWAEKWVTERGLPIVRSSVSSVVEGCFTLNFRESFDGKDIVDGWRMRIKTLMRFAKTSRTVNHQLWGISGFAACDGAPPQLLFPNYGDYGYGIFLLDEKSRDYVLKNIQNEKDPFLRSMMWGALWDSVREGELDPREYVERVVWLQSRWSNNCFSMAMKQKVVTADCESSKDKLNDDELPYEDESTTALLLNRVATAMNYYLQDEETAKPKSASAPAASGKDIGKPQSNKFNGGVGIVTHVENMLIYRMQNAETQGQRITYYRAFLNVAASEKARGVLKQILNGKFVEYASRRAFKLSTQNIGGFIDFVDGIAIPIKTKDKFDIVTKLLILNDPEAPKLLAELEKTETSDDAKRWAYAARAGIATAENKAKYWKDFTENKEISESWIEAAFGPWNSIRHSQLTLPYLERALKELPNHKANRKIFFVNGWLGAFIGGQRSEEALGIINKYLADNPNLDNDLRLKILENADTIERAVKIRERH